jgi:hypothetical protein
MTYLLTLSCVSLSLGKKLLPFLEGVKERPRRSAEVELFLTLHVFRVEPDLSSCPYIIQETRVWRVTAVQMSKYSNIFVSSKSVTR